MNKILNDYINEEEIVDSKLKEIEEKKLMMKAISETDDYKLYNMCSNELKNDYEFVKFLVLKYRNNIPYICKIANNFLKNHKNGIEQVELAIIMSKLTANNEKINNQYIEKRESNFQAKIFEIEFIKEQSQDLKNKIGLGFLIIEDQFKNHPIILQYYVEKFLEEIRCILYNQGTNLEEKMHDRYHTKEEIKQKGIKSCLLNFISLYDLSLTSYLSIHPELLDEPEVQIEEIINNWDNYEQEKEKIKYKKIFDKIHKYMEKNKYNGTLTESELLYYIGNELDILDKINQFELINYNKLYKIEQIIPYSITEYIKKAIKTNFIDGLHYKNIKELILSENTKNKEKEKIKYKEIKIYAK